MATSEPVVDLEALGLSPQAGLEVSSRFFRGLGDPTRLKILLLLLDYEELAVSDIVDAVGTSQGRVSSHLACLRWCGLVADRREGRYIHYSIPDGRIERLLRLALAVVADNEEHISSCHNLT